MPEEATTTDTTATRDTATQETAATTESSTPKQTPGSWLDAMPDEMKGSEVLARFKGADADEVLPQIAKSFLETKSLVGANTVALPERTAEDEKWDGFYSSIGKPQKPEAYELPKEGLPEGFEDDDPGRGEFRAFAHAADLDPRQAAKAYRSWAAIRQKARAELTKQQQADAAGNLKAIEDAYGDALPERTALAKRLIGQFDDDQGSFAKLLNETGLGDHPAAFAFIDRLATQLKQDQILGTGQAGALGMSKVELDGEIRKLENDKDFMMAYQDKGHPNHQANKQRMTELYKKRYPESA